MHWSRYLVCLWPGLPELWYRGRWGGLPAALLFTAAINFLIVARFIYPEWLLPLLARIACWVAVAVWAMWVLKQVSQLQTLLSPRSTAETPDGFPHAQTQYLRGNWPEAEAILNESLEIDPRDCQSLLLLASIYRQTQRWEAARESLLQLERLETADAWWLECETEARKLKRAIESAQSTDPAHNTDPASEAGDAAASKNDSSDDRATEPPSPPATSLAPDSPSAHKSRPPGDSQDDSSEAAA